VNGAIHDYTGGRVEKDLLTWAEQFIASEAVEEII